MNILEWFIASLRAWKVLGDISWLKEKENLWKVKIRFYCDRSQIYFFPAWKKTITSLALVYQPLVQINLCSVFILPHRLYDFRWLKKERERKPLLDRVTARFAYSDTEVHILCRKWNRSVWKKNKQELRKGEAAGIKSLFFSPWSEYVKDIRIRTVCLLVVHHNQKTRQVTQVISWHRNRDTVTQFSIEFICEVIEARWQWARFQRSHHSAVLVTLFEGRRKRLFLCFVLMMLHDAQGIVCRTIYIRRDTVSKHNYT